MRRTYRPVSRGNAGSWKAWGTGAPAVSGGDVGFHFAGTLFYVPNVQSVTRYYYAPFNRKNQELFSKRLLLFFCKIFILEKPFSLIDFLFT